MPNIKQFEPGALGYQPTEVGIESTAAAARRSGAFFNQKAQALDTTGQRLGSAVRDAGDAAVKYMEHREISAGAAKFSQMEESYTAAWNKTANSPNFDPNDPSAADQFRAGMQPSLDDFKQSFLTENGRNWAEGHVDRFREHMFHKITADVSKLAGDAVIIDRGKTLNSQINRVYGDPNALEDARSSLRSSDAALVDSSPTIDPQRASSIKVEFRKDEEKLVRSAILGTIAKGGDWRPLADKNSEFINQAEIQQFIRQEQYYKRLDRAEARADKNDADNEARTKFHGDMNKLEMSLFNDDGELIASKAHIAQFRKIVDQNQRGADLEPGRVSSMLRGLQSMVEKNNRIAAARDDPATAQDLTERLWDPDNPTTMIQIGVARNDGKLGPNSAKNLAAIVKAQQDEFRDPVYKTTMSGAKSMLGNDPIGAKNFTAFAQDFAKQYQAAKRAGTLPPDWANTKDENSFISKIIKPYQRDPTQMLTDRLSHGILSQPGATGPAGAVLSLPAAEKDLVSGKRYPPGIWDAGTRKFYP